MWVVVMTRTKMAGENFEWTTRTLYDLSMTYLHRKMSFTNFDYALDPWWRYCRDGHGGNDADKPCRG